MTDSIKQTNNPDLTLILTLQEVNSIISALHDIPYKSAEPLLRKILPQAQEQVRLYQHQLNQTEET